MISCAKSLSKNAPVAKKKYGPKKKARHGPGFYGVCFCAKRFISPAWRSDASGAIPFGSPHSYELYFAAPPS